MAYLKTFVREDQTTYEYHRISGIELPRFKRNLGWDQAAVTVVSYKDKPAANQGAEPVRQRTYPIPFVIVAGIVWDSQEHLLAWAYGAFRPFLDDLTDADNDLEPDPEVAP